MTVIQESTMCLAMWKKIIFLIPMVISAQLTGGQVVLTN